MKVLIADDNDDIVESTALALEVMDIEAVGCTVAAQILDAVRRERPDVVLQDVRMPGLDLEETLRALRADADVADVPVLLFTGNESLAEDLDRGLVQGVVHKPFELDRLVQQLHEAAG